MEDDGNEPGISKPCDKNLDLENIPNNEVVDSSIDVNVNSAPILEPESSKPDLEPEGSNPESSKTPRLQQRPEVGHRCSRIIILNFTMLVV